MKCVYCGGYISESNLIGGSSQLGHRTSLVCTNCIILTELHILPIDINKRRSLRLGKKTRNVIEWMAGIKKDKVKIDNSVVKELNYASTQTLVNTLAYIINAHGATNFKLDKVKIGRRVEVSLSKL